jgi:hypothetical protein
MKVETLINLTDYSVTSMKRGVLRTPLIVSLYDIRTVVLRDACAIVSACDNSLSSKKFRVAHLTAVDIGC